MNKKITVIEYNSLNLPIAITFQDGSSTRNVYSSAGVKLRSVRKQGSRTTTTDYCGNVIYENGALSKVLTQEGYVTFSGTTPTYHYYLQDHLGNNRVVINQSGAVEEVNHYYPFGSLFHTSSTSLQAYKYNGKELDRTGGLDWYDYGARNMDAALGVFPGMDPMCEKYYGVSPYAYCNNNPIKYIDLDGRDWYINDNTGELYYQRDLSSPQINISGQTYTRVGGNNLFGYIKGVNEKFYNYEESEALAQANGYSINPTQQIMSEISREQPYKTGPNTTTIITGKIEIVNEKYALFSADKDKQIVLKTENLYNKILDVLGAIDIFITGAKPINCIERNNFTYEKSTKKDKIGNSVSTAFGVIETVVTGKHDYREIISYNNWSNYSSATKVKGRMLNYK